MLIPSPNGLTEHGDSQICHPDEEDMYMHMHFDHSVINGQSNLKAQFTIYSCFFSTQSLGLFEGR